jgi:hypothetical protein
MWEEESIPHERKYGITCPVLKKENVIMCDNYRAVTLLCTTNTVLANILNKISVLHFGNSRKIPRRLLKG